MAADAGYPQVMLRTAALVSLLLVLGAASFAADRPYGVAAGVNIGGGQIDWRPSANWMFEARAQAGAENGTQKTTSALYGLRAYRFLHVGRPSFFAGMGVAKTTAKREATSYRADGVAAGAFLGFEFRLIPHVYFLLDAGPYVISLHENRSSLSRTSLDFVGDAALVVGF